ncbi:MAG: carbamoyltransferase HypF [Candidatus Marinimicrobia bacterium]|jgi:hydrogenase maturation protein HypF|nr:carbamoyltransferase HypF [Candidatus Neomarinimicrobiota bacterium]MBT3675062.1 carbamoyltransferase HypF [Candidatus Neomarinimicrobiota bacterium]MBT3763629.1 carbamoyltransferase HypF [Candidatus Neomarinimicrobiota bacterium]MBT4068839.1 carbamoyltransferase HypF [Candidatus Neomarinimicrobiota bacterium]MBT4271281.1 carbamoyltransferase HypF [Candidatus Neomarinimicrobiota bacterium]
MSDVFSPKALKIYISGMVQGVGFRPFIYKLARANSLTGHVKNTTEGVSILAQGNDESIQTFLSNLRSEAPPLARIFEIKTHKANPNGLSQFKIVHSQKSGEKSALILPDMSTCDDCLIDIAEPTNRRYQYPFTNCTNCGPRFSIIKNLPYDRPETSMAKFKMCTQCQSEYDDPENRRFHAQPNACPNCGPQLSFWNNSGTEIAQKLDALIWTIDEICQGKIIALKGLGGFQLICDARNSVAVNTLRKRKNRPAKPFALMVKNLQMASSLCEMDPNEISILTSPEKPILILKSKQNVMFTQQVAPGNPNLGLMLPYTPLHELLMSGLGFPIIATSGNLANEPICIDEAEALERLGQIADGYLIHTRPIVRPVDDSVVRLMAGKKMILRRARGYAPFPIQVKEGLSSILATGAHLKNTITVTRKNQFFMSQHIGNLDSELSAQTQQTVSQDLIQMYDLNVKSVACDLHPDYQSTTFAKSLGLPLYPVQHHIAHIWSVIAEHHLPLPVFGLSWDGTGLGVDNTIWGSEFFTINRQGWKRTAHLKPFKLPGVDLGAKEPRRSALGLLFTLMGNDVFDLPLVQNSFKDFELDVMKTMFESGTNIHETTSMGRLFDAVSFISGYNQKTQFEGQAAMDLEFSIDDYSSDISYPITVHHENGKHVLDWTPMVETILHDVNSKISRKKIAYKFHESLSNMIGVVSELVDINTICLSGGCFQNKTLLEQTIHKLRLKNFKVYWNQDIPINDGGISMGQAAALYYGGQKECV